MRCTECPELGKRVSFDTFICNLTGNFLSIDDVTESDRSCPRDKTGGFILSPQKPQSLKYSCKVCGELFDNALDYKIHRDQHKVCRHCQKSFSSVEKCQRHESKCKKKREAVKMVKCRECDIEFGSRAEFLAHANQHHSTCRYCGKKCSSFTGRNRHEGSCEKNPKIKTVDGGNQEPEPPKVAADKPATNIPHPQQEKEPISKLILWRSAQQYGGSCQNCAHEKVCVHAEQTQGLDWVLCKHWVPSDLTEVAS